MPSQIWAQYTLTAMARNSKNRKGKYRIAIVGEGHTEWHYFDSLRTEKRYKFQISPELPKHSDYESIFRLAEKLSEQGYDEVFCVLDLDVIVNPRQNKYESKKNQMLKKYPSVSVFESLPCFELWFLLHFTDFSGKSYHNSAALLAELRRYLPDYEKHIEFFKKVRLYNYIRTKGNEHNAFTYAEKLCLAQKENKGLNFTNVPEILKQLESAKANK